MSQPAPETWRRQEAPPPAEGQLGLWDAISIIIGIVIGVTIFKVPWLIFGNSSDPWSGLLVWVLGGVLALVGALCYAELATTYPRSGGDYFYQTRALGPWLGFLFGWAQLMVVFTASIGAMAFVFGEYATQLKKADDFVDLNQLNAQLGGVGLTSESLYAAAAVLVLTLLNVAGVVFGKITQNILTAAKILSLIAILVAGFGWAQSSPMDWKFAETNVGWGALAMILVLYAYGGWNDAAFVAAEVRNPRRNIPRALIIGVTIIIVVYLLINTAYLMGLGYENVSSPGTAPVPARLLENAFPGWGGTGMSILVMLSALGAVNGLTFTGARIYATLGQDYTLFGWLGHWKPGKRAPVLALLAQAALTLGMIFALGTEKGHELINQLLETIGRRPEAPWQSGKAFETLVDHTAPVFWVFFLLTGVSLFLLREKDPGIRPFSVPLYPWLPIIFCNTCAFMVYQSTKYVGERSLFAFGLVLLGVPIYFLAKLLGGYKGDAVKASTR
jgi:APA family basic amino acid/polyamine antiporter